jgi:serine/threonine-protein kinase PpkA
MTSPVFDIPGYEFVRELGVGGMATVFLATQRSLERNVAIKVMRRSGADENFEKRFLLEGRTMAKLPHRNIVGVYDIVQNETINYIAMEYLGGGTLSERMRDGLSLAEAISVVVQIAGALQFAHESGVVHRDLKPANIMFRDAHTPVLTDFGIARQKDAASTRLTQTGMMIGTPTYMSPEQAMANEVDGRSDQYSLGILFYEMLTGAPPFGGATPLNVVLAHINQPPPPLPDVFAHFQPVLDRMLAKDREQRYPDLNVFVRELKAMLTSSDTLLSRLQIDPSQTASEQLRLLGFSESQINTGSRRAAMTRTSGERTSPRTSGPGVRLESFEAPAAQPPPPPRRPRWMLPAGVAAAALLLLALGWALLRGRSELDPAIQKAAAELIGSADRLIAERKFVSPPGDNAYEKLQLALQLAPDLADAQERLRRIRGELKSQAEQSLAAKSFVAAETRVSEALAVAPDDPELVALLKQIELAKLAQANQARVAGLLQQAETARKAGRLYGEGDDQALARIREALQVDPQSAAARTQLAALTEQSLRAASEALKAGRLEAAGSLLDATSAYFGEDAAWQQLSAQLVKARDLALQRERVDAFLQQARAHVDGGRYVEPAGDNALESLARVAELEPDNIAASALRREIGIALSRSAEQAERAGDIARALARYDQALLARPDNAEYAAARKALEQRLGDRERQLAAALTSARGAINARRYLAPKGDNARDYIDGALRIDAANRDAIGLRDSLPELVRQAAAELGKEARYADALALLADAAAVWPRDAQIAALATRLAAERDSVAAAALRIQRLAELRSLQARAAVSADDAGKAAAVIAALLAVDPADADAGAARDAILAAALRNVAAADSQATLASASEVLRKLDPLLPRDAAARTTVREAIASATQAVTARERERIAANSGTLLLNAYPWADVESIVDQASGSSITLPKDRSTPLRIVVPAGTYRISFRHPQAGKPVVLVAGVQAKMSQSANASFPTITARDYLRRAGYAP